MTLCQLFCTLQISCCPSQGGYFVHGLSSFKEALLNRDRIAKLEQRVSELEKNQNLLMKTIQRLGTSDTELSSIEGRPTSATMHALDTGRSMHRALQDRVVTCAVELIQSKGRPVSNQEILNYATTQGTIFSSDAERRIGVILAQELQKKQPRLKRISRSIYSTR